MINHVGSFIKRQTSGTSSDNEWQRVVQQVATMTTSGTTSDNEWYNKWYNEWQQVVQRVVQRVTTNGNEWQQMTTSDHFGWFFFFSNKRGAYQSAPEGELFKHWKGPLKKAYWIKSRNKPLRRNINSKKEE